MVLVCLFMLLQFQLHSSKLLHCMYNTLIVFINLIRTFLWSHLFPLMSIAILNIHLPPMGCRKVRHGRPLGFPATNTQTIISDDATNIGLFLLLSTCSKETLSNYNKLHFDLERHAIYSCSILLTSLQIQLYSQINNLVFYSTFSPSQFFYTQYLVNLNFTPSTLQVQTINSFIGSIFQQQGFIFMEKLWPS